MARRRPCEPFPDHLARDVDTILRHAFKVTDSQIERLQQAGYSEDVLFDVTVNAAVSPGSRGSIVV